MKNRNSFFITPSIIIEYTFCPRFIYFMFSLAINQHEEKRFKVQKGRNVHKIKLSTNKEYLRRKLGAVKKESDVFLSSEKYHLKGIVDEVLTLTDGTMAPLDYKFAEYKEKNFLTYRTQSLCYGILISENYNKPVNRGFIIYTRSKNKLIELEFTDKDRNNLFQIINEILFIIQKGYYPSKTKYKSKCPDCTYRNLCV